MKFRKCFPNRFFDSRGRKVYPRKSNDVCSCEPRRSSSLQYTMRVFCSLSPSPHSASRAAITARSMQGLPLASSVDDDVVAVALERTAGYSRAIHVSNA